MRDPLAGHGWGWLLACPSNSGPRIPYHGTPKISTGRDVNWTPLVLPGRVSSGKVLQSPSRTLFTSNPDSVIRDSLLFCVGPRERGVRSTPPPYSNIQPAGDQIQGGGVALLLLLLLLLLLPPPPEALSRLHFGGMAPEWMCAARECLGEG